jgi:D-alanyl-D-alanine carboxypeptidase
MPMPPTTTFPSRRQAVAVILAAASFGAAAPRPPRVTPAGSAAATADGIVAAALRDGPYPGVVVAVARRGQLIYRRAAGLADVETRRPMTFDTRLPIGSVTKSFTGLSVMQLVDRGLVDLDRPIGSYLPDVRAPAREIPVRNLLNHTGGLVNYLTVKGFPYDHPVGLSHAEVVRFFDDKPLMFPPGAAFSYSNSGLYLAGLMIERVTGEPYERYVAEHVFQPFGMDRSGFDAEDADAPDRAHGYRRGQNGFTPAVRYDRAAPFAAGAVVSTAGDLLKYADGRFGPKTRPTVRKLTLTRDRLNDGTSVPYMLGCLIDTDLDGRRKYSHAGDIYGFASHFAHYPDDGLTVVVLTNLQNASFPPATLERKVARVFLGLPQQTRGDAPLSADDAARFVGDYRVGDLKFGPDVLGFVYQDGKLNLRYGGRTAGGSLIALRNQGGGVFAAPADDEQLFRFAAGRPAPTLLLQAYDSGFPAARVAP